MAKFWGSNQSDDRNGGAVDEGEGRPSLEGQSADEHTRLLPNPVDGGRSPPFLSPDDPAVTPYNLWSVRAVRFFTVLFAVLTFLFWTVQLISAFVSPPGWHPRGGSFFAFGYSSIALITLLICLIFFSAPSRAGRILSGIMAVLLTADMIIVLAVERTRHEEVWTGVAAVIWALVMAVWALFADRMVRWGKAEEEERLTGRVETRRTLLEWTEVTVESVARLAVSIALLLMTFTLILRAADAGLVPPGERYWVDGDKYQIHLYCHGNETNALGVKVPTVLFEAGEDPVEWGLWQFADDAVKNGSISRYCFADRPGVAWSDAAPSPMSASIATDALSEALARAGETGPWVLASAGIGSIYSRVFSSRKGAEVAGILLIDPLHEDLLYRVADPGRGFLLWLQGVISPLGLELVTGAVLGGRTRSDRVWGRSSYRSGKRIFAKLQESLVADSLSKRDVISARAIQMTDTPLVVITSGVQLRKDSEWEDKQRDLTHITSNLQDWDVVKKAPHAVWKTVEGRDMIERRLKKLVSVKPVA